MFLKVEEGLSGLEHTIAMRQPGGRVIRVRIPLVPKKRGVGQVQQLVYGARRNIPATTPQAVNFASAPGCNVVDLSKNACMLDDGTVTGCNVIRECDPLTGSVHCQYGPYPGQAVQPGLPFCTGSGPSNTGPVSKAAPSGPSTPFTPTQVFGADSGVVLPAGSSARIASPASSSTPTQPVAANQQTTFLQNLLGPSSNATPATPVNLNVTTSSGLDFLTNPVNIFGFAVPVWLIGVAVVGGGVLLLGGKKH